MKIKSINLLTLLFVVLEVVTVTVPFFILQKAFQFPQILRQPAAEAFGLFQQNQSVIIPAYYVFMLSGLLFLPLSYVLKQALHDSPSASALQMLSGVGTATAVFQAIGFCRWIFVVPYLTQLYFTSPETKPVAALLYETLNRYAGMTIGEHLGFIAMGVWTLLLSAVMFRHPYFKKWMAVVGFATGTALIVSTAEHFGGTSAATYAVLNVLANSVWSVWLLAAGILIGLKPYLNRTSAS